VISDDYARLRAKLRELALRRAERCQVPHEMRACMRAAVDVVVRLVAVAPAQSRLDGATKSGSFPIPRGQPLHALRPIRAEVERRVVARANQLGIGRKVMGDP
jgi:hypothetical protein